MDQQHDSISTNDVATALRKFRIEAIEGEETRVRKPRHWLKFTLRAEDGRVIQVKMRHTGKVGDTIPLDDRVLQVGLWKP